MDASAEALDHVCNDLVEYFSIRGHSEQCFAMIATQHDVVATTGDVKSRESGHPCTIGEFEMTAARVEQETMQ